MAGGMDCFVDKSGKDMEALFSAITVFEVVEAASLSISFDGILLLIGSKFVLDDDDDESIFVMSLDSGDGKCSPVFFA